ADDVATPSLRIAHLHLDVRNVHVQPGATPTLVAAPVRARAVIDAATVTDALAQRTSRVELDLLDGGARAYLAGRRSLGYVDLVARVDRGALVLAPRRIVVGSSDRLTALARRLPGMRMPVPPLPAGVHVTGVTVEDGRL